MLDIPYRNEWANEDDHLQQPCKSHQQLSLWQADLKAGGWQHDTKMNILSPIGNSLTP